MIRILTVYGAVWAAVVLTVAVRAFLGRWQRRSAVMAEGVIGK